MKLDKTSYYPQSPLDDEFGEREPQQEVKESLDMPIAEPEVSTPEPADIKADDKITKEKYSKEQLPTEAESIFTSICHWISWLLVPLLMPVYAAMLAFSQTILAFSSFATRLAFVAIIALINLGVPTAAVLLFKRIGLVKDLGLNDQKERTLPYVVCILCLAFTSAFMAFKGAPDWFVMFFAGSALTGVIEVIVNRWWKISVHAAGAAGITAMLLHLLMFEYSLPSTYMWLMISIGLAGLLGTARVWLRRHTLWQVLAGYAVGFCSIFFIMMIRYGEQQVGL